MIFVPAKGHGFSSTELTHISKNKLCQSVIMSRTGIRHDKK